MAFLLVRWIEFNMIRHYIEAEGSMSDMEIYHHLTRATRSKIKVAAK